jgi:hypothetical protein
VGNDDTNYAAFNPHYPINAKAIRDTWQKNITPSTPEDPPADITITTNKESQPMCSNHINYFTQYQPKLNSYDSTIE